MSVKIEDVFKYAQINNRVCPKPFYWNQLHDLIPNNKFSEFGKFAPEPPLILSSWWEATPSEKSQRFTEHLEWAEKQNSLPIVYEYLAKLSEKQWFHGNDWLLW
ncbi:hypothetical protein RS130_19400 [Paraglaciecola aquimarina]|uniref:Uncharacterized protein n=1 Tax=Paraglaciecola aquimarina TaxID=1235557 RepID=A0ABU3T0G5_9ALTE|nr:hypothetical protein [Paraglaciecola aquimarina]MDU0355758.1 hypothetical protein [Paraglaciecola aquimarina]